MLWIFLNVANIEETIKVLQCCYAFKVLRMLQCFSKNVFKDFASVAKTLKMLQMLRNLQIIAHFLNVAKFAVPS